MTVRGLTITTALTFFIEECCVCGIPFGMTQDYKDERVADKKTFYCPNGHDQCYLGKSKDAQIAELKTKVAAAQSQVEGERHARQLAEKRAERQKSERLRIERRTQNGVCPYCNHTFVNMARHMHTKHPDAAHAE